MALRVFPGLELIAAEPGPGPRAILENRFSGRRNVLIDPRAVTDAPGKTQYHVTRSSVFASLLEPMPSLSDLYSVGFPTEVLKTIEVSTVTLDELVGERPVSILKLDVQGSELGVLRGGSQVLASTAAVLIEVLFLPHYEGDTLFPGIHAAMTDLGFTLMELRPFRLRDGPVLWADACYAQDSGR